MFLGRRKDGVYEIGWTIVTWSEWKGFGTMNMEIPSDVDFKTLNIARLKRGSVRRIKKLHVGLQPVFGDKQEKEKRRKESHVD